mgnify:CR=1 FL=1
MNVRKKERNEILHKLFSLGALDATKYGGMVLKYTDENSPTEFMVESYDDILIYYRRWRGEQVVGCSCGRLFLKKYKNEQFCNKCKQKRRRESHQKWIDSKKTIDKVDLNINNIEYINNRGLK